MKCPRGCVPAGQLGMLPGEWWLDEHGFATFADSDTGMGHEDFAYLAALDIQNLDAPENAGFAPGEQLTKKQAKQLLARGVDPAAVTYFRQKNADARDYAVEHMGWSRVKGTNFEVWVLDDDRLRFIQNAEFWEEGDEDSEQEAFVEERSTGKTWSIPFKTLLSAKTAEGLKRYMDGAGKFR